MGNALVPHIVCIDGVGDCHDLMDEFERCGYAVVRDEDGAAKDTYEQKLQRVMDHADLVKARLEAHTGVWPLIVATSLPGLVTHTFDGDCDAAERYIRAVYAPFLRLYREHTVLLPLPVEASDKTKAVHERLAKGANHILGTSPDDKVSVVATAVLANMRAPTSAR
jgi:hypothetical protein